VELNQLQDLASFLILVPTTVLFTDESKPGVYLLEKDTLCYNLNAKIKAQVEEAKEFIWTGPGNYTGTDSTISFKNFSAKDTGTYIVTATTATCGTAKDSIRLIIDQPVADFNFTTNGCKRRQYSIFYRSQKSSKMELGF